MTFGGFMNSTGVGAALNTLDLKRVNQDGSNIREHMNPLPYSKRDPSFNARLLHDQRFGTFDSVDQVRLKIGNTPNRFIQPLSARLPSQQERAEELREAGRLSSANGGVEVDGLGLASLEESLLLHSRTKECEKSPSAR